MDAPAAGTRPFSSECDGLHYVWRGMGPGERETTIGVYNGQTETWTVQPTTGHPPPGVCGGGCAIIANRLYCFGGFGNGSRYNTLHELDLNTYKWTEIFSRQDQSKMPICKEGCGFVPVDENTLACFGGYGIGFTHRGSSSIGGLQLTNEFHLFDLKRGEWSLPQVRGERPPPCYGFSFTKIDKDKAVLFGGDQPGDSKVSNLYLFNLRNIEVTKIEPGDPWPVGRLFPGACCLNYDDSNPQLLVCGGLGIDNKALEDMWLLDVTSGSWTEVTNFESMRPRWAHSITSTFLEPGLTKVLVFGGRLSWGGAPITETTTLRFEYSQSEKWALVGVGPNDAGSSSQQLRKKRKIMQTSVNALRDVSHSSSENTCSKEQSVPVLPRNWTATNTERNGPVYQNSDSTEVTSTPPGYPLSQVPTQPKVIFYDKPQEREFSSTGHGGHTDFDNGVEVTIPPEAITPGATLKIKIQPSFAPNDVFVLPEGVQSASPSYLISCDNAAGLNGEATVAMEHHVGVFTKEEAEELLFLQADPTPNEEHVYKYRKMSKERSKFILGVNKGQLSTKTLSKRFLKIGVCPKCGGDNSTPPLDRNLYTVRLYRSPPQTTGDRLCVVVISLFQRIFFEFLRRFENDILPYEYPALSKDRTDRTVNEPLRLTEVVSNVLVKCDPSWSSVVDQKMISKDSIDLPVTGNFEPGELQNYPPRMVCRFFPDQGAVSTTCSLELQGFNLPVTMDMALLIPKPSPVVVNTSELQVATESLKNTASLVKIPQLSGPVEKIVSFSGKLSASLSSPSCNDLSVHTDSIKNEMGTFLTVSRKLVEEAIEANFSKMEILSRQLCQVSDVKLKPCQDESEETVALVNLVESGVGLLTTVDCFLRDMKILSTVDNSKALTVETLQRRTIVSDAQLDKELKENHLLDLANCFDEVETYLYKLNLTPAQQTDIKDLAFRCNTTVAMAEALKLWRQLNPFAATFRALLEMLLSLRRGDVAVKVCEVILTLN